MYAHVDQHAITFHPHYDGDANQIALIGNDGGVFRTTNARAATATGPLAPCVSGQRSEVAWTSLNRGYGVTQFYHGTPFPDGTQYLAGAQDNGTLLGSDAAGPDGWRPVFGGDGGFSAVHPTQTGTWLMEFQWASARPDDQRRDHHFASANGPRSDLREQSRPGSAITCSSRRSRTIRIPIDSGWAANYLYRGPTFGLTWQKVGSRDARRRPHQRDRGVATHRRRSRDRHGQGRHRSRRATPRARRRRSVQTRPRNGWVTSLAFDPLDDNVALRHLRQLRRRACLSQHRQRRDLAKPRRLRPGAALPTSRSTRSSSIRTIRQRLYLGTDLGVMVSIDGGRTWMSEETGFGPAVTMWLSIVKTTGSTEISIRVHAWSRRVESAAALTLTLFNSELST